VKRTIFVAVAMGFAACSQSGLPSEEIGRGTASLCSSDGEWRFSVTGTDASQFNGQLVAISAAEPSEPPGKDDVRAWLQGVVENGRVQLSCERGISTNYQYPSWAIVVDVDHDGKCSDDDLGFSEQLYGWNGDLDISLVGDEVTSTSRTNQRSRLAPVREQSSVWGGAGFCSYYFGHQPQP
jgi:hypothetical protein